MTAQATPLIADRDVDISEAPTHALAQRHAHKFDGKKVAYVRVMDMDGTIYPSGENHEGDPRFQFEDDLFDTYTDGVAAEVYTAWKGERGIRGKDDDPEYFIDRVKYVLKQDLIKEALRYIDRENFQVDDPQDFVDQYIADNFDQRLAAIMADSEEKKKVLSNYKDQKRKVLKNARAEFQRGVRETGNFAIVAANMGVDSRKIYNKVVQRLNYNQLGYAAGTLHRHSTTEAFETILDQKDGVQNYIWTNAVPWHAAHVFRGMDIDHDKIDGVFSNWDYPRDENGDLTINPAYQGQPLELGDDPHMGKNFPNGLPWGEDKLRIFGGPLKTEHDSFEMMFTTLVANNQNAEVIVVQAFENSIRNLKKFKDAAAYYGEKLGVTFEVEAVGMNWDGKPLSEEQKEYVDHYATGSYALVDFVEAEFGVEIERSSASTQPVVTVDEPGVIQKIPQDDFRP